MMRGIVSNFAMLSGWLVLSIAAQAQTGNRTPHSGPTLPSTCILADMFTLTTAPAGANIYSCVATNTWAVQGSGGGGGGSGTLAIRNNSTAVGTEPILDFVPGFGIVNLITDTGTAVNIQQTVDTAVVLSKATHQAGTALLCAASSGSGTTYTCAMSPTLTAYTRGMVLYFLIDTTSTSTTPTLNVDTLGAKTLVNHLGGALSAGDLVSGTLIPIWYDGTNFRTMLAP
jgi:hypothetical protein